jgi:hypothetical protein
MMRRIGLVVVWDLVSISAIAVGVYRWLRSQP